VTKNLRRTKERSFAALRMTTAVVVQDDNNGGPAVKMMTPPPDPAAMTEWKSRHGLTCA